MPVEGMDILLITVLYFLDIYMLYLRTVYLTRSVTFRGSALSYLIHIIATR